VTGCNAWHKDARCAGSLDWMSIGFHVDISHACLPADTCRGLGGGDGYEKVGHRHKGMLSQCGHLANEVLLLHYSCIASLQQCGKASRAAAAGAGRAKQL
jgi:hypothetical protein